MANLAKQAIEAGYIYGFGNPPPDPREQVRNGLTPLDKVTAAVDVLEGIEAFRASLPWWKRWTYCIGAALKDLREVKDAVL